MPRARVLRKALRRGSDGRAKVVRDNVAGVTVEHVYRAGVVWRCMGCKTRILRGDPYFRVSYLAAVRYHPYPMSRPFHLHCLPEQMHPCLRFFGMGISK